MKKRAKRVSDEREEILLSFCVFIDHDRVNICGVSNAMGVKTPFMRREVRRCLVMESHSRCERKVITVGKRKRRK